MPLGAFKAALMGTAGVETGLSVVLLHDTDYSGASVASITSGIDSTYGEYIFKFYNIHPAEHEEFTFNGSTDSGSNYNITKTSTSISAYHAEDGIGAAVYYITSGDLSLTVGGEDVVGTTFQQLAGPIYTDNDSSMAGELHLFNPSSTTYVKHFTADTQKNGRKRFRIIYKQISCRRIF